MKLLRVCVAVVVAVGLFMCVGCGDNKVAGPDNSGQRHDVTGSQPLNAEWLPKSSSTGQSLAGTTWKWEAVERMTFPFPSYFGAKAYTLEFKVDGTIVAYSWVNTFWGRYTVDGATYKINFDDFGGTKVGGVDEDEWCDSFRTINSYELSGNDLTLFYNNGSSSLVYRKVSGDNQDNQALEWRLLRNGSSSQSLTGITWKLSRIVDVASGSLTTPNEGSFGNNRSYTLEFKADGTLETRSSVNTYWGTYTVEYRGGDEVYIINIADFGGTKAWDGIVGGGDDLWSNTFPAVETISLQGSGLRLYYNNNQSYLLFHVATDAN